MKCPRCSACSEEGFFFIDRPVRARIGFVKFSALLSVIYCPKCGLLKLSIGGIQVEGVCQ